MSDNATANNGGMPIVFSTDDLGGVHVPRQKIMLGQNGFDDGTVSNENPMPVSTQSNDVLLDVVGAITYIGKAAAGSSVSSAVWQISRLDETTQDISLKHADGVSTFSKVWNDRLGYNY